MTSYIGIFLLFFSTSNAFLFPENKELIYNYRGTVQVGSTEPSLLTSEYEIFAEIHALKIENGTIFQLKEVNYGSRFREGGENISEKIKPPSEANALNYPFIFYMQDETFDGGISVDLKDKMWSINMKRSIANLFQVNEKVIGELNEKDLLNSIHESSSYGISRVTYTSMPSVKGHIAFNKKGYYTQCPGFVWSLDTSVLPNTDDCGQSPNLLKWNYIQRTYDLVNDSKDVYVDSIHSDNNILFSVLDDENFVIVNQTIKLMSIKTRSATDNDVKTDQMIFKSLEFEKQYQTEGIYDLTGGRRDINVVEIKADAKKILHSVYNRIRYFNMDLSDAVTDKSENVILLLEKLKQLNEVSLFELYTEFEDAELINIYLTTLPLLGTKQSVLTIQKLIKEKQVENDMAVKMLREIPFHIKRPEILFVESLMEFAKPEFGYEKSIRNAAIISVSALMKTPPVIFYNRHIEKVDFSEHFDYFVEKLKNATEHEDQLIYMSALMNMQNENTTSLLDSIVRNEISSMKLTPHLRSLAMFGVLNHEKNIRRLGSMWRMNDIFPIFLNTKEDLEVRATALYMVLSYGSAKDVLQLYWFVNSESNQHFQRMFYTALDTFSRSTCKCHKDKATIIQNLAKYMPKPKINLAVDSFSKVFDYFDSVKKYGSLYNAAVFGDINVDLFQTAYFKYTFKLKDYNFDQYSIYVHVRRDPLVPNEIRGIPKIFSLDSELMPVEVIIFRKNFVISAFVTSFKEITQYVLNLDPSMNFPLSYGIHQNFGGELTVASEMGVPITFYLKKPLTRMNQLGMKTGESRSHNLTLNLWDREEYGLKVYNPIADVWHGVQRVHSLDLKFQADTLLQSEKRIWKLMDESRSPLGFKSSMYTEVYTDDGKVMQNMIVPNNKRIGDNHKIWSFDDSSMGLVYSFDIVGCNFNNDMFRIDQINDKFLIPDQKNWGNDYLVKLLFITQYIWDSMSVFPGTESCKMMLKIKQSENYPITHYETTKLVNQNHYGRQKDGEFEKKTLSHLFEGVYNNKTVSKYVMGINYFKVINVQESYNISIQNITSEQANPTFYMNISRNIWSDRIHMKLNIMEGLMIVPGHFDKVDYSLIISMTGRLSEEQKYLENFEDDQYKKCSRDPAKNMEYCVKKLTALRSYEYDISYDQSSTFINFMNTFNLVVGKYLSKLERTNDFENMEKGKMKVLIEYPLASETVDVSLINEYESFIIKDTPIGEFLTRDEPFNTFSFNSIMSQRYCEFTVDDLWNSERLKIDKFVLQPKWTRMTASCFNDSYCYWEIQAKKINEVENLLALRIIVGGNEKFDMHINETVELYVDDKPLETSGDSRYIHTTWTDTKVFKDDRRVLTHIKITNVNVEFSGNRVKIILDSEKGSGLCHFEQNFSTIV